MKALQTKIIKDKDMSLIKYLIDAEERYIETIYEQSPSKGEAWKAIHSTGNFKLSLNRLIDSIYYLEQKNMIKPYMNFLDMGCGLALNSIVAASKGLNVYGIETNEILVEGAKQIILKSREDNIIDTQSICKIVQGNYFPEEYRILRQNNQSKAVNAEETHYKDSTYNWKSIKSISNRPKAFLYPKTDTHDAYKELGISLKDIDIMYVYCWAINVPSILEIFSKYTRDDAILLIKSQGMPRDTNHLLETFNLNYNFEKTPYHKNPEVCQMDIVTKNSST